LAVASKKKKPGQAGRPTLAELERRKKKVLEVATKLFVRDGYSATSLVDIAKGAGVATRTVYQHFGDKPAIFQEVIYARDIAATHAPPDIHAGEPLFETLMRTARFCVEVALSNRSVELMRLMVAERNRFPELMKKVANATFFRFQHNVEHVFQALAAQGAIPEGNHGETAELFTDLVLGQTPMHVYTDWLAEAPTDKKLATKIELFILGRFGPAIAQGAHGAAKPKAAAPRAKGTPQPAK
jgi:TetR/AcrR family transcriptional regulator, mexJK operon transcriptional repressor